MRRDASASRRFIISVLLQWLFEEEELDSETSPPPWRRRRTHTDEEQNTEWNTKRTWAYTNEERNTERNPEWANTRLAWQNIERNTEQNIGGGPGTTPMPSGPTPGVDLGLHQQAAQRVCPAGPTPSHQRAA
mmetsp:Transcript_58535/g.181804  ORF Transcript_58535/g.181804 Transcript_58535/m.181804 type:complete len:132 (+) Transcript_58535:94-489(+)